MRLLLMVETPCRCRWIPDDEGETWMKVKEKVIMTTMIKQLETQLVDHMEPEDLEMVMDLKNPKDPLDQWPLPSSMCMSNAQSF